MITKIGNALLRKTAEVYSPTLRASAAMADFGHRYGLTEADVHKLYDNFEQRFLKGLCGTYGIPIGTIANPNGNGVVTVTIPKEKLWHLVDRHHFNSELGYSSALLDLVNGGYVNMGKSIKSELRDNFLNRLTAQGTTNMPSGYTMADFNNIIYRNGTPAFVTDSLYDPTLKRDIVKMITAYPKSLNDIQLDESMGAIRSVRPKRNPGNQITLNDLLKAVVPPDKTLAALLK